MWQQDPFQVDRRLVNDSELLKSAAAGITSKLHTSSCSSTASGFCCWHREATLVQSPVSVNSEASVTSTPDQCPASPAASLCEMPSSRNGGNNLMANTSNRHPQHISGQWKNLPSGALTPASATSMMGLDCTSWSTNSSGVSQAASSAANASFAPSGDSTSPYDSNQGGWNPILTESKGCNGSGYAFDGLNEALVCTNGQDVVGVAQAAYCVGSSAPMASNSVTMTESCQPGLSPFGTLFVSDTRSQRIKQEEEQYPAGPNPMVIDEKMFCLQKSGAQDNSKIGNFIDLLRQSDSPVSDATTAASCNHLSQLLTSQEASGMWIARSSRLPAMLSEVLPPSSGCKSEGRSSRLLKESIPPNADVFERAHTGQRPESSTSRLKQDRDEPLSDRPACLGVAANDDLTSELFSKRPRIENSSSFPFKMQVRKEKLGERISALQQLVSPFGKTDTASVLLEAIGYIKFLHEQVQVLSSPYMKNNSTTSRNNEHGKFCWTSAGQEGEEAKQDLRSRGLCLVPISCTLQVANDNGADYWTPTLHGGLK